MKKKFNIFNFILKIGYDVLIAFCIILIMIIFMQKITANQGSIGGFKIFTVVSGSMEPKYSIGEVVICRDINKNDIQIGDTIVYQGLSGQMSGKVIMHDVVDITYDENKNLVFHARGLENDQDDPDVKPSQIYGVCIYESYLLTLLYGIATSTYASAIIIVVLVLNVFLSFKSKKQNRRELNASPEGFVDLSTMGNEINQDYSEINEEVENNEYNEENEETEETEELYSEEEKEMVYAKYEKLKRKAEKEAENRRKIEEEIKRRLKNK